ncbi:MAG: uracil-DNA glycosylase [Hydrogenophilales bacterium]|nr:uracil-DNA glycosylase [Hydrogenophilales bacterium]
MSANQFRDTPKSLSDPAASDALRLLLAARHIAPLSDFVQRLRTKALGKIVPEFDPWDGGIDAEVLYLLEAPGPKARDSGFVSRNNPDETAKNFFLLNKKAGIPRERTICWNAVPWYIGSGTKIRTAKPADLNNGLSHFFELLSLLPKLRAVVLVGRKAEFVVKDLECRRPDLKIFRSPHPSPMYCNRSKENPKNILNALHQVAKFLVTQPE